MPLIENPIGNNLLYRELIFFQYPSIERPPWAFTSLASFQRGASFFGSQFSLCSLHCWKGSPLQIILCCQETLNFEALSSNSFIKISLLAREVKYFTFQIKNSPNLKVVDVKQLKLGWICPLYNGNSCDLNIRKIIVPTLALSSAV